jgi:alkanesulfonate monooxygenase SsuD/methylene tetrahydromethanopterin reductase-like flavin-dependent oxidoreductase (luciferase family)
MELGVHFVDYLATGARRLGPTLAEAAKTADEAGAAMFTLADHFLGLTPDADDPFPECYTSLGFLAGRTEKITLGERPEARWCGESPPASSVSKGSL